MRWRTCPRYVGCRFRMSAAQSSAPGDANHVVGEIFCVAANAGEQAGLDRVHPVQAQEIEPRRRADPALLQRSASDIQDRGQQPAVVVVVAGRPDDRCNVLATQIQDSTSTTVAGRSADPVASSSASSTSGFAAANSPAPARKPADAVSASSSTSFAFLATASVPADASRTRPITRMPSAAIWRALTSYPPLTPVTTIDGGRPPWKAVNRLGQAAHPVQPPVDVLATEPPWDTPMPGDRQTVRPARSSSSPIWQPDAPLPTTSTAPSGRSSGRR